MMRKFFLRRLWIFLIYMLIPTLLIFLATFCLFLHKNEVDLQNEGKQTVLEVETNIDLVLSNVLYQNDLLTNTTKMSLSIKKILTNNNMTYGDAIYINSLTSILNSIIYSHSYIDSIYLYLDNCNSFFSSITAVQNLNITNDSSWVNIYNNMDANQDIYVTVRNSTGEFDSEDTLSVFRRLLLQKGCIIVNINIKKFQDILGTLFSDKYESIYLLNSKGEVLVTKANNDKAKILTSNYFKNLIDSDDGNTEEVLQKINSHWVVDNGKKFLINTRKYDKMDVYIVSVISSDERTEMSVIVLRTFLLILVVNFIVIMILAYITTKRTFDQISFMIQVFNDAENGIFIKQPKSKLQDEYDVIMNNIINFFLNTSYLNTQLKEKQYRQKVAEMTALQLQINPHFLFNTLQTLELEVRKNTGEIENISNIIRNVSAILKYALSDSQKEVALKEEIEYLKKYVLIQKYRFGDSYLIYYEVEDDVMNASIYRLMLQPLVENSLIHGIRDQEKKAYIKIKIYKRENYLCCYVIDNGIGMTKDKIKELYLQIDNEYSRSIGLTNLNRRLILSFGKECGLHIQSKSNYGTCISFKIPYQDNEIEEM